MEVAHTGEPGDRIVAFYMLYQSWIRLLPGFKWITWSTFFLGLVESFLYGIYVAPVFVPLYNFFKSRFEKAG